MKLFKCYSLKITSKLYIKNKRIVIRHNNSRYEALKYQILVLSSFYTEGCHTKMIDSLL